MLHLKRLSTRTISLISFILKDDDKVLALSSISVWIGRKLDEIH